VRQSVVVVTFEGREGEQQGLGTGFVIDAAGLIATNFHVIGEGRPIAVQLADGSRHAVTEVTASDRGLDLAIVRIVPPAAPLAPLPLGDSSALPDGLRVLTVGNPHGLTFSVVGGVVSGTREIDGRDMLQLAMPIEPGNSGGPVVGPDGGVVGIVTIKSLVTRNLGFAVGVDALKPLVSKPNPVPMARWLSRGGLDPELWETRFGGRWQQRGGRIAVRDAGSGFGGRTLCLSRQAPPAAPFDVEVDVKLDDEAGAAGLVFHADGGNRHYGFYPTAGKLRFTRFDGPSVYDWKILRDLRSPHYKPGAWNRLLVRVEAGRFRCSVNGSVVATIQDEGLEPGRVGLAKFRDTVAEFKRFRVRGPEGSSEASADAVRRRGEAVDRMPALAHLTPGELAKHGADGGPSLEELRERAASLERRAMELRLVAADLHTATVVKRLQTHLDAADGGDLLRAALEIARLDDEELDVEDYVRQVGRMAEEVRRGLPDGAAAELTLAALEKYLFADNGFHGSRTDYYHRANSHLSRVIDDREGLPITLSILYMELARRLGVDVEGVGLPGHFVVRHPAGDGDGRLIDVFEGAITMSREQAAERVRAATGGPLEEEHLRAFDARQIIRRVLRNLLGVADEAGDREAALRYLEALVAVDPTDTRDRGRLALVRFETGRRAAAVAAVDWFLEHRPPGIDEEAISGLRDRFLDDEPAP
jgi:regulator of sirC expression with transglutaminase-like and TPR domain